MKANEDGGDKLMVLINHKALQTKEGTLLGEGGSAVIGNDPLSHSSETRARRN